MKHDFDIDAWIESASSRELLRLYGSLLGELIERGVVRSRNAPAGDLAERLAVTVYDGQLAPPSEKSWDVRDATGRHIQVKSRVLEQKSAGNFSFIRSWSFDACVFVVFDARSYDLVSAVEVPAAVLRPVAVRSEHVNGWRIGVRRRLLELDGARDVTYRFQEALKRLP